MILWNCWRGSREGLLWAVQEGQPFDSESVNVSAESLPMPLGSASALHRAPRLQRAKNC